MQGRNTQSGDYFITICTKDRKCLFGRVTDGEMRLSNIGRIASEEWVSIPKHYENLRLDSFQLMPNHLHGIITILDRKQGTTAQRGQRERVFGKPISNSLSTIVGSYKAGVTRRARQEGYITDEIIWQPRFFDRIIRDDVSHYFIRLYIELNPLLWECDPDNPGAKGISPDEFERLLRERYGIEGRALAMILNSKLAGRVSLYQ